MIAIFKQIVSVIASHANALLMVVRNAAWSVLQGIWSMARLTIEYVWGYTIGLAGYTVSYLFEQFNLVPDVDLSQFLPYVEFANYWLPISEGFVAAKVLYSFYSLVFAYRWVKWALPFL